MYNIIFERRAAKEVKSLPTDIIPQVFNAIESLKLNPRPHNVKKLIGEDGWRIRVRDYRILYTIDDSQKVIAVYRIKHRRDAYR